MKTKFNKAFWEWFGDSKVVDESGQPLVVYHGTNADFDKFDTKEGKSVKSKQQLDFGSHFTQSEDYAKKYSKKDKVYPVYLIMKNPLNLINGGFAYLGESNYETLVKLNKNLGIKPNRDSYYDKLGVKHIEQQNSSINQFKLDNVSPSKVKKALIDAGYDGVIYQPYHITNITGHGYKDPISYIAFSPNQIKSATGNDGTWDIDDDSILSGSEYEPKHNLNNYLLNVSNKIFELTGIQPAPIRGNIEYIYRKRLKRGDKSFSNPNEIRIMSEYVLTKPSDYLYDTFKKTILFIRKAENQIVVVLEFDFKPSRNHYIVKTVHYLKANQ